VGESDIDADLLDDEEFMKITEGTTHVLPSTP
jgi:hypothetical protein